MMHVGLQTRFAIAAAAALALVLAMIWGVLAVQRDADRETSSLALEALERQGLAGVEQRGRTMTALMAEALVNPVYYVDLDRIGGVARSALAQPDVRYVYVYDRDGNILHDGSRDISRFGQPMDDALASSLQGRREPIVQHGADNEIDVAHPLWLGDEPIGGVRIGLSLDSSAAIADAAISALRAETEQRAGERLRALLLPLVGMLLIMVVGLWLVARGLVAPTRQLAAHARALASGDYGARLDSDRHDEMGELIRTLGQLGASLSAHDRDIRRLAYVDTLTGLPNRLMLRETLADATRDPAGRFALLFIDLDDFKRINDTLGHDVGDEALVQLAARLRAAVATEPADPAAAAREDLIARFGGDEFVVIAHGSDPRLRGGAIAERMLDALRTPIDADGTQVHLNGSIGVTVFPDDGRDPAQLLKNGDVAMYQAKLAGKNCHRYFADHMLRLAADRLRLEQDLREAMQQGTIEVHYQPIREVAGGRLVGGEALLRWEHPARGRVPTALFVALAEDFGLIDELGRFALDRACRDAAGWPVADGAAPFVSVNLSVRQLRQAGLPAMVAATLVAHGLPASRLHLELTESALLDHEPAAIGTLAELRRQGVRIWLDDFGTGFSGLSHLRRVPVDGVKVDRSFVQDLAGERADVTLTAAIVAMATSLGIEAVAEGVETQAQLEVLRGLGCGLAQGWLLGHPVPQSEFVGCIAAAGPHPAT
jgi:diguanylate cyclase (GGDEF)-like protein